VLITSGTDSFVKAYNSDRHGENNAVYGEFNDSNGIEILVTGHFVTDGDERTEGQDNRIFLANVLEYLHAQSPLKYKSPPQLSLTPVEETSFTDKGVISVVPILFLAADPTDASRLRLGEEFREIQEKLKLAKLRDRFRLELPQLSTRPADISQALLDVQPQIVHFSGHGTSKRALCFENQVGETHLIQPDALAALFEQFAHQINCVLLNACYSEYQAKAIAKHIQYVIGMNQAISDEAAIAFAIGFYQALGAGRTIREAYKLGCVQIGLQGLPEHLTPVLLESGNEAYGLVERQVGILSSNRLDISVRKEIKKFTGTLVANAAEHSAKTVTGYELYLLSNGRYLVYVHCIHNLGDWVEARLAGFDTKGMILEEVQRGFPVVASQAGLSPVEVLEVD